MTVIEYLKNTETRNSIISLISNNLYLYQGINTEIQIEQFTGSLYNIFVKECVQSNQYISLSNKVLDSVNEQYRLLIIELLQLDSNNVNIKLPLIVEKHRNRLIELIRTNEYSESIDQLIIPCFEYTNDFQEKILRIDNFALEEPILDIGCGINCSLVKMLKQKGYNNVFGIDQYINNEEYIISSNWLDFTFKKATYGTIISHMAFSNHYKRAIVCNDSKTHLYEKKYYEILDALKKNGLFIYTPTSVQNKSHISTN